MLIGQQGEGNVNWTAGRIPMLIGQQDEHQC